MSLVLRTEYTVPSVSGKNEEQSDICQGQPSTWVPCQEVGLSGLMLYTLYRSGPIVRDVFCLNVRVRVRCLDHV